MAIPSTMRAVVHIWKPSTLTLTTLPIPRPNFDAGEHLLRVHSIALTRGELSWPRPRDEVNYSPGVEMSGTIVTAPPASKFPAGTKVYMRTTYPRCASAREYSIGMENELAKVPNNLSDEEAAAVPVSALTAWQGLFVEGGLKWGERKRILVNGAAGSVGMWYVYLAKAAGMDVVGTCSPQTAAQVAAAGADVIDYTSTDLRSYTGEKFDLVVDCVGHQSLEQTWYVIKDGGLLLTIVQSTPGQWKWILDRPEGVSETVNGKFFIMSSSGTDLARITKFIEEGQGKPMIDSIYKLEDYEAAFEKAESGRARGKVVIKIG